MSEAETEIRGQLLNLVSDIAGTVEVTGENLQLASEATGSVLAKPNSTTSG